MAGPRTRGPPRRRDGPTRDGKVPPRPTLLERHHHPGTVQGRDQPQVHAVSRESQWDAMYFPGQKHYVPCRSHPIARGWLAASRARK
jgi:hypothetical protein